MRCTRGVHAAGPKAEPGGFSGEPGFGLVATLVWGHLPSRLQLRVSTPQSRQVPSACFLFWHCPLPSHGVICLLSLHFQLPLGHPPSSTVTHFVPSPLTLHLPPGRLLRGLCPRRCCGPRGQRLLPGEPSVHLCPLAGDAGGKLPPRPFPSDKIWRRPRPGRRREGLPGCGAPLPCSVARAVCVSLRKCGDAEKEEEEEEGVGGGSPLK